MAISVKLAGGNEREQVKVCFIRNFESGQAAQMLYDVTVPDKKTAREIAASVGSAYALAERLRMGGIGSQKFNVTEASAEIFDLVGDTHRLRHANIELRESGIIVHFRSRARSMAWVIPYWRLSIQMNSGMLSLHAGRHFMRLADAHGGVIERKYVARLYELQAKSTGRDHDIYGSLQ